MYYITPRFTNSKIEPISIMVISFVNWVSHKSHHGAKGHKIAQSSAEVDKAANRCYRKSDLTKISDSIL